MIGDRLDREAHERIEAAPALNAFGLPKRNPLRAVGIDGGYVKAADAVSRQEGWFEVMVGKSLPRGSPGRVFAFVYRLEEKPTIGCNDFSLSRVPFQRNQRPSYPMVGKRCARRRGISANSETSKTLEDLNWDIGTESERAEAVQEKLKEFMNYVMANLHAIPSYADRHRHGEPIATGFVEPAVH